MNNRKRPKLYPPKALLWKGPIPALPQVGSTVTSAATLPPSELRRIVHEMLG